MTVLPLFSIATIPILSTYSQYPYSIPIPSTHNHTLREYTYSDISQVNYFNYIFTALQYYSITDSIFGIEFLLDYSPLEAFS